jgi:hypothetical protein
VQFHRVGSRVTIYSRNGHDFTGRFPSIAQLLHELPAKAAVLDGEFVASNADGSPNFARLHVRWTRPGAIHLLRNRHSLRGGQLEASHRHFKALKFDPERGQECFTDASHEAATPGHVCSQRSIMHSVPQCENWKARTQHRPSQSSIAKP